MDSMAKQLELVDRSRRAYGVKFSLDDLTLMESAFISLLQMAPRDERLRAQVLCLSNHIKMMASVGP